MNGEFLTGGRVPSIPDWRVTFFKGRFQEVLPTYEPPSRGVTTMNLDADLYSSTIYGLRQLQHLIVPGTYLYFAELRVDQQEFRAFRDFVEETGRGFRVLRSTRDFNRLLFACTA